MSRGDLSSAIEAIRRIAQDRGGDAHLINDLASAFSQFDERPVPADFGRVIDDLQAALPLLFTPEPKGNPFFAPGTAPFGVNTVLGQMATVGRYLQDWTGEAAAALRHDVLDRFAIVARNQFVVMSVVVALAQAQRALWDEVGVNIHQLAQRSAAALGVADQWCHPRREWVVHFTGFEAATAALEAALPVDGVDESYRYPFQYLRRDRPGMWISGSTANAVLATARGAVLDCGRYLGEIERVLGGVAQQALRQLDTSRADFEQSHTALADIRAVDVTGAIAPNPAT